MIVEKITPEEWRSGLMTKMYLDTFGSERDPNVERCDFVLVAKDSELDPVGFITCHEMDSETLYWQFGGATEKIKKTIRVSSHYSHFLVWSLSKYKRVTTRIENKNLAMLRMALKVGFLVIGVWNIKNKVYLELCCEGG
jgi:hypothetical protein